MGQLLVTPIVEIDTALAVEVQGTSVATLIEDEQCHYKRFRKMDPPQFQHGKIENSYEVLTTCKEFLRTINFV